MYSLNGGSCPTGLSEKLGTETPAFLNTTLFKNLLKAREMAFDEFIAGILVSLSISFTKFKTKSPFAFTKKMSSSKK